jgi:hypothetical protein
VRDGAKIFAFISTRKAQARLYLGSHKVKRRQRVMRFVE